MEESHFSHVGLLGIEPRPHVPKTCILPLYYSPQSRYLILRAFAEKFKHGIVLFSLQTKEDYQGLISVPVVQRIEQLSSKELM